jgi:uncharacterized repeat protein (TIGR02543 family)
MRKLTLIALVMLLCCALTTSTWAARKIELKHSNVKHFIKQMNERGSEAVTLAEIFGLSADGSMSLIKQKIDFTRLTHKKYQQLYSGFPVWGYQVVVSESLSKKVMRLHGNVSLDIKGDIKGIPNKGSLDPQAALEEMKAKHQQKDKKANWFFDNEEYGTYIYIHKNGKAYLTYIVSFFADNEKGNPSRYIHVINAKNGQVLHSFDSLAHADGTGPGGNQKIGQYYYGTDFPPFGVTQNGSTCTMNTTDVKSVNLNHGTSGSTAYSYTCFENTFKQINGAYSPINDAQYFGQVVYDMYQDWYGLPVLTFQLMMRVHYSTNYENAFWNGSSMTFGDGYNTFYPLVSLDVSAHEVAHGFTDQNSDLIYSGQSGGINEAYSDMAGEAAEFYSRGSNDFLVGYDIFKSPSGALRYMHDPPLDGQSIDHISQYYSGMDVHYSSGLFNKVFWLIATSSGWDTHKAFDIFTRANTTYWTPSTNFQQGAEGVMDATADYGYDCGAVASAWAQVGITVVCAGPPVADFSGSPLSGGAPLTVNFTDLSSNSPTSWSWNFGDSGTSTQQNPSHTYTSAGTYTVTLTATNSSGSDSETKTNYITVNPPQPPVADFTASSTSIVVGDTVNFTDLSTNTPTSWSWTFAGGTPGSSTAQNPSITYNTAGTFDVSLTATNAQGSDSETKVGYITVSTIPYCTSSGGSQSYEYIAGVSVADLSNNSGASPYSDYTGLTANVNQNDSVSVSLTPGFTGSSYTEYWRIWVDYNGDHDFADAGEQVFSGSGSSVVSGSFTVPTSTIIGNTRMRVSMSYSTYAPNCGSFTYGEVEDYTINISPAGATYTLSTNTVGNGSITLNPPGGTYGDGTVVTCTAVPDAGWQFDGWSGDLTGSTNPQNITMNSNKSITATFSLIQVPTYTLTVNTSGQGTVSLNPPGGTYDEGTVVTLTATPDTGWQFSGWSGDLTGSTNPDTITMNSNKTVTATFTEVGTTANVGIETVGSLTTTTANRRAMPFTMPENGTITSVTMYHIGGSGNMILGVYDGEGAPGNRIGVTATTPVSGSTGWQTINLQTPVNVNGGTTIHLAWVYESNPGIAYVSGSPGRWDAGVGWSGGMPATFGSATQASYLYSIYATYTPTGGPTYNNVGNTTSSTSANRRAMPFTMPETGTIESVTMYHTGGSGDMILAVYNGEGTPQSRIAITPTTAVSGTTGWQTISLTTPVVVQGGTTVWLAWVYQSNPGIRYQTGSPGRYQSSQTWSGGMPDPFGSGTQTSYIYSIYATYSTTIATNIGGED